MLTRAQVAKRLGKSIATVRRLEGSVLHPRRDPDGVHRFDPREVDDVAASGHDRRPAGTARKQHPARSRWLEAELAHRDDNDTSEKDDSGILDDDACTRREAELAQLEEQTRTRARALDAREQLLRERESTLVREREETAAEALRNDLAFRCAIRTQIAHLMDDLDRLPARAVAKILSEDDLAFLLAVVSEGSD